MQILYITHFEMQKYLLPYENRYDRVSKNLTIDDLRGKVL